MFHIKVFKLLCQSHGSLIIRYQVGFSDRVKALNLADYKLRITVSFKILDAQPVCDLHADEQGVVLSDVIGAGLGQGERPWNDMVVRRNQDYSKNCGQIPTGVDSGCHIKKHLPDLDFRVVWAKWTSADSSGISS